MSNRLLTTLIQQVQYADNLNLWRLRSQFQYSGIVQFITEAVLIIGNHIAEPELKITFSNGFTKTFTLRSFQTHNWIIQLHHKQSIAEEVEIIKHAQKIWLKFPRSLVIIFHIYFPEKGGLKSLMIRLLLKLNKKFGELKIGEIYPLIIHEL